MNHKICELYNFFTKKWKKVADYPDDTGYAFYLVSVLYYKGGFVYFGGITQAGVSTDRIERLDAVTHSWSHLGYLKGKIVLFNPI